MKLMFVYESMARWGGIERVWTDKINWFVNTGYDVKLITTIQGEHPIPYEIDSKVEIKDLQIQFHHSYQYKGVKKIWTQWRRQKKFEKLLKQELNEYKPDIIICVATNYVETLVKLKSNIPLIAESHETCLNTCSLSTHSIIKIIQNKKLVNYFAKVDCIVSLTEGDAKEWRKYNNNVKVITNTVHLNSNKYISDCTNKRVIFVGRIAEQKGLPALFKIWEDVTKRHPDWTLDLYGEGESATLTEWVNDETKKQKNIVLHKPTDKIFDKYCECSIFVLTSTYEPFGLVLPEAMSCGLPVIAFDCPYGPTDIITDGIDGFLIPQGDTKAFANKICNLIENPELRKKMGAAGVISSQRYAAANIMPQWVKLFNEIVSTKTSTKS